MTRLLLSFAGAGISMSAAILVLLLFFRLSGRKYSARCAYIVWAAVILRLCVPFQLLPSLVRIPVPEIIQAEDSAPETTAPEDTYVPSAFPSTGGIDLPADTTDYPVDTSSGVMTHPDVAPPVIYEPVEEMKQDDGWTIGSLDAVSGLIIAARFLVAAVCLTTQLVGCAANTRRVAKVSVPAPDNTRELYERLAARLGVGNPPPLYIDREVRSPMLCGFVKPRVILPELGLPDNSLVGILAHELIHYRRRDLWMKFAGVLASSLCWYNPLVRIASRRMSDAMELACDEELLRGMDRETRGSYGRVLLDILKTCRTSSNELSTHFNPRKNSVKERFVNIMDDSKKKRGMGVISLVLVLCLTAGIISCTAVRGADSDGITDTDTDNETTDTMSPDDATTAPDDTAAPELTTEQRLAALLTTEASEIRKQYGELKLEYSERGPGQPVYSIEKLPGVYLVYHGWDMDTPLMDYQLASEVMLSGDSDLSVYDLRPGDMIEDYAGGLVWNKAGTDFINGLCTLTTIKDFHKLTVVMKPNDEKDLPPDVDDSSEYDAWFDEWSKAYMKSPEGIILQIRVEKAYQKDYPESDGTEQIVTTLDGVRGLADTGRISENAYNFLYNMLSGKSAIADYNKFDVPSFTMTVTDTRKDLYFTFDFTVKDSSLDTLPDGEYHWRMTDGVDCFRADEETDNSFADVEEVRMLKAFLTGTFIWNTPTYGEGVTYPGMNNFLTNYYGDGSITLDEYTRLAKEKFGCTDINALGIEGLIRDNNGVKYVEAGGIGGGWNGKVMYANKDGDHTLVGMRYFADCNSIVKSHLVEYRFGKGGTWLGYKIVERSEYEPYGLHFVPDEKTEQTVVTLAEIKSAHDDGMFSDSAYDFLTNFLGDSDIPGYDSIKVSSFSLTFSDTAKYDPYMKLEVDVTASGVNAVTVGKHVYTLNDDQVLGAVLEYDYDYPDEYADSEEVKELRAFFAASRIWNTPFYGKGKKYPGAAAFICDYYGGGTTQDYTGPGGDLVRYGYEPGAVSADDMKKYAEELFGCDDLTEFCSDTGYADGVYTHGKSGGVWSTGEVFAVWGEGEEMMVTMRFYHDVNRIVKSHLVTYTFKDGKWMGYEMIEKSDYEPWGLGFEADE